MTPFGGTHMSIVCSVFAMGHGSRLTKSHRVTAGLGHSFANAARSLVVSSAGLVCRPLVSCIVRYNAAPAPPPALPIPPWVRRQSTE